MLLLAILTQVIVAQGLADPAPLPAVRAHTDGDPGGWVTDRDYPASAQKAGVEGFVGFAVAVDPGGNVAGCVVTQSSNTQVLDEATCSMLRKRAHFIPARDATGHAVSDVYRSKVKWVLPGGGGIVPNPLEKARVVQISYIVEKDGAHTGCHIDRLEGENGTMHLGPVACHDARSARGFTDEHGTPVRRMVTISQAITIDPVP